MMWNLTIKLLWTVAITFSIFSCKTREPLVLESDLESEVSLFNINSRQFDIVGKSPIKLENPIIPFNASFRSSQGFSRDLVILDESSLQGTVKVPLADQTTSESSVGITILEHDRKFIDGIMKIHRLILRGELTSAKRLLDTLELQTGASGPLSDVMRGNIAVLSGNIDEAKRLLRHFKKTDK